MKDPLKSESPRTEVPASRTEKDDGTAHIRVYLVDDHPPIRDAVESAIGDVMDLELCGQAETVDEASREIGQIGPDVAVVDISIGDEHGLDLVQAIQTDHPEIKVLVYSMYDEEIYAERALRHGAKGYVMKTEPAQTLLNAIRNVHRGEIHMSREMTATVLNTEKGGSSSDPHFPIDELSGREMEVFRLLGQGKSLEVIKNQLDISRKTVETYRRRAKEKLGLTSVRELRNYALHWSESQRENIEPPGAEK